MNLAEFIAANAITVTAEWKSRQLEDNQEVDVWAVVLRVGDGSMNLPFRMGQGLNGRTPSASDVLECLLSDASSVANANGFNDWLSEFHMDTEEMSVKELKELHQTYDDIEKQAAELSALLGDAYDTALWHLDQD